MPFRPSKTPLWPARLSGQARQRLPQANGAEPFEAVDGGDVATLVEPVAAEPAVAEPAVEPVAAESAVDVAPDAEPSEPIASPQPTGRKARPTRANAARIAAAVKDLERLLAAPPATGSQREAKPGPPVVGRSPVRSALRTEPPPSVDHLLRADPAVQTGPADVAEAPRPILRELLPGGPDDHAPAPRVQAAPLRVVLVEDVPGLTKYLRERLQAQSRVRLLEAVTSGGKAGEKIRDLHPDVVIVDSLLQGRTNAREVIDGIRATSDAIGVVALTVPNRPLDGGMAGSVDAVVTMPFATFDIVRAVYAAHSAASARNPEQTARVIAVFASKGGVGKTTIAYNLAVAFASGGLKTVLVDGSLQFGDIRLLLRIPVTAPSMADLPPDVIRESDIRDVVFRGPSGIDVLPAPPRPEMSELIGDRDMGQLFRVLRGVYQVVVVDTAATLSDATLAMLDAADSILHVVTLDTSSIERARLVNETFAKVGYSDHKVRLVLNRADTTGVDPHAVMGMLGNAPDYRIRSDWQVVGESNGRGVPFVTAQPHLPASLDILAIADDLKWIDPARLRLISGRTRPS